MHPDLVEVTNERAGRLPRRHGGHRLALLVTAAWTSCVPAVAPAGDRIFIDGFEPCCKIGGTVSGVSGFALLLHLHAGSIDEEKAISKDGLYQFENSVPGGTAYTLGVEPPQPQGFVCAFTISGGTMGSSNIDSADVDCVDSPPVTTINPASEPADPSAIASAAFQFTSSEPGSTFTCQLDDNAPTACDSGSKSYSGLSNNEHTFSVRAMDAQGHPDAMPATYTWVVDTSAPTISQTPPAPWTVNYFSFAFSGPVAGIAGYECSLSGAAYTICTSPQFVTTTYGFSNTFSVRWMDTRGNRSAARTTLWTSNQGLVLYYPFNNDAANYSVLEYPAAYFEYDGSLTPTISGGYAGGAAEFAAAATFANAAQPLSSGFSYAVSIWIYDPGGDGAATAWQNMTNNSAGCRIAVTASTVSGDHATMTCVDGFGAQLGAIAGSLSPGWNNLSLQYYGGSTGSVDFYVNGNPAGTVSNPMKYNLFPANQSMKVGPNAGFPVDELRVYNTTFSSPALCTAVIRGTWNGQQSSCQPPILGMHYAFDGAGPVINRGTWTGIGPLSAAGVPSAGILGGSYAFSAQTAVGIGFAMNDHSSLDLALSAWFNDSAGGGRIVDVSCTGVEPGCAGRIGGVYVDLDNGIMNVCAFTSPQMFCAVVPYTMNQWNQIVLVSDEYPDAGNVSVTGSIDIFLDGVLAAGLSINGAGNPWSGASDSIKVGQGFSGYIDEVKLWGTNLPQAGSDGLCTLGFGRVVDPTTDSCE